MPRQTSTGTCTFCHGTYSKGAMTRHLRTCKQRQTALQAPAGRGTGHATPILHVVVEGHGPYWLHLEVRADATLATLDAFLRDFWLECCGHMSQFGIDGEDYVSGAAEELSSLGGERRCASAYVARHDVQQRPMRRLRGAEQACQSTMSNSLLAS